MSSVMASPSPSSSPDSNPSPSSSKEERQYDVFLTYLTKCETIVSLETSLNDASISTFIDHDKETSQTLLEAIELSRIVIIVFTKHFGSSRYFLDKLHIIINCHKNMGKKVFPVFCGVSLSSVRQEMGSIAELTSRGDLQKQEFFKWRNAYAEATSLPFRRISTKCSRYDRTIKKIVHSIKILLDTTYLDIPPYMVPVQHRMKEVLHLSKYYSQDITVREEEVIIVGICGVVGIGKSTIARMIYNTISVNFESRSFIASIKKVWEDNGPVPLQEQLISNITGTKDLKIHDAKTGMRQIKMALQNRRSLVVLDDVDHIEQLVTLCGSREWFGFGSMILITSRSKHIFDHLKVKHVYEVRKMDKGESLELLSWHAFKLSWNAFKQSSPSDDFINLAKDVIVHCEGLPLVTEVLGSLLYRKTIQEWECVLKKLKSIPTNQIQEKMKISCEYLDDSVKDLFSKIACFYVGEEKLSVIQKLSGFQFPVEIGINTLVERSLIKFDMNNRLHMHELLQDIGKRINPNKPKRKYNYHVFLSFCGYDTREGFASHLWAALKKAGLEVFMDPEIRRGDSISSSLIQAIESSRTSILILSVNYAGSSWCMKELEKIMECHRTVGQQVFPIFFGVQPSHVRKLYGDFGSEFEKLKKSNEQKSNWTKALKEVSNFAGWGKSQYRTEAELIERVIDDVTKNLDDNTNLFVTHHPVGLRSRMKEIIQILSDQSNEIKVLGIHGMGGIGKTTIAKAIYNEVGKDFEAKSFLAYIKEASELENGLVHLQEQLLSNIFPTRRMTLPSFEMGKGVMKERLCGKKALIVLDSVTNEAQLDALFGSREWYGPGSRIIITTRDEHVFDIIQADSVYEMREMNDNESLELFSWHAFKQETPIEGFIDVSKSVTDYCEGLPLALEVLGAYLCDRPMEDWKCAMDRLKEIPDHQIHKKLRIGYDGLSYDYEKDIFLDICCFFIGVDRNYVTQILNGCGLHADIGIIRLIELSLLRVDKNNKLSMHGLIRDMGREIVREESLNEPGYRSRLWSQNNVIPVLRNFRGTTNVNGLALSLSRTETQSFDIKGFEKMESLRLLQLRHVNLNDNYEYLSKELRWLCWHGFPSSYLPQNFYLENVVAIDLRYSRLTQVWKNCQLLEKLKILNLSHSHYLRETPDFSRLPNLERLLLKDCPRLSYIHESIGDLKFLILVNLKGCKDLSELPKSIYNLKSLKILILYGCSKLEKLEDGITQMESLTTLMANETAITQVPPSLVRSRSITHVSICGHEGLPRDVFPILIQSWVTPRINARSLLHGFAVSMPFLLPHLLRSSLNLWSRIMKRRPHKFHISGAKALASIGLHDQVYTAEAANFPSSLATHLKSTSQDIKGSDRDGDNVNTSTSKKKGRGNKKKGRGNKKLKDLALSQCTTTKKVRVEFDVDGRAIGIERDKFISYIGHLAQTQVGILFSNWHSVPEATKNKIWDDILLTHDIPSSSKMKQQVLKQVCDQWKDFQSTLTKDYIRGKKKGESPCSKYPFINEDTWKKFVKSQDNPKPQKSSVANKERQPKNFSKHYWSPGGYKMEEKIIEPNLKVMEEVGKLDHNIVIQSPTCPTRQRKREGEKIKKREAVVAVAEKIDSLKKQSTQSSFTPSRETTILATALGKSDYPKHGEASCNSSSMVSKEELHELLKKERKETIAEMLRIQNDMLAEVKYMMISSMSIGQVPQTPSQGSPMVQSEKSSNNLLAKSPSVDIESSRTPEEGVPCILYLEVPNKRIVTNNRMYTPESTTHHQQIQNGQGGVAMPFPTDKVVTVGQAKENFVHGHKGLIEMVSKMTPKKESLPQLPPIDLEAALNFPDLAQLRDVVTSMEEAFSFKMPSGIVGADLTYNFIIDKKDLIEFVTMKELDAVYMQLAILLFHRSSSGLGTRDKYGFMCPQRVQKLKNSVDNRKLYVMTTMVETKLSCYLAPLIEDYHWTLVVVCPPENTIYWFDSMGGKPSTETKTVFETALSTYFLMGGIPPKKKGKPKWIRPIYRRQLGQVECGYYVIRYMHEIILKGNVEKLHEIFHNPEPYTNQEIDEIRDYLSQYILQRC